MARLIDPLPLPFEPYIAVELQLMTIFYRWLSFQRCTIGDYRIVVTLMYKVKNHQCPKYISDLSNMNTSGYALRNVDFSIPRFNTVNFGRHSIRYLGPVLWSKLSPEVRQSETLHSFKNRIRRIHLSALRWALCNS